MSIMNAVHDIIKNIRRNMEAIYQLSYNKLWHKLIGLKLKKKDLQKQANLSPSVIAKMGLGREESVNLETLAIICLVLHCGFSDIVDIILKEG